MRTLPAPRTPATAARRGPRRPRARARRPRAEAVGRAGGIVHAGNRAGHVRRLVR